MAKNTFATLGILAVLVLAIGMVSAVSLQSITTYSIPANVSQDAGSFDVVFDLVNSGLNGTINFSESEISTGTATITFNDSYIENQTTETVKATVTFDVGQTGNIAGIINVTGHSMSTYKNLSFSVPITTTEAEENTTSFMCEDVANPADLSISIEEINVKNGFGDDEDYWYPLDEVEIEIEVANEGDDTENIEITFCLYDVEEEDCILDEDDVDLDEDDFDLDHNDEQTVVISFQVDADDLSENNNYEIRIGATGEVDDSDSDFDGNDSCTQEIEVIEIRTNEEFVVLNDIKFEALSGIFGEDEFLAGSQVKISGEVWNVGDSDIDDDDIFLEIYSSLLGINEVIEFDSGINSLDMESFEKIITIPADAEEKSYKILFTVYDDENMVDKNIYENSEDDTAEEQEFISVKAVAPTPTVNAELDSVAEVGEELVVKATITNEGETNDFLVSAEGFESWAELVSVSPQTASVKAGEDVEVVVVLNPTKAGTQSFMINTIIDGEDYNQAVSVKIEEKKGFFNFNFNGLDDTVKYVIIAIIALVILILLVLIAKASRRPAKPQF